MSHGITVEVAEAAVEMVQVALHSNRRRRLLYRCALLDVSLREGQVSNTGRVSPPDRAFLEVALQNITARESIVAKNTAVGAITGVSKKMALQVLSMQIRLCAMGARELAVRVFYGRYLTFAVNLTDWNTARSTWKNAATSLATNNMSWLLALLQSRALLHHGVSHHALLIHDAGHRA